MNKLKVAVDLEGLGSNAVYMDKEHAEKLYIAINSLIGRHLRQMTRAEKPKSLEEAYASVAEVGLLTEVDYAPNEKLLMFHKCSHCGREQYRIDYPGADAYCNYCNKKILLTEPKEVHYECDYCGHEGDTHIAGKEAPEKVGCSNCKSKNDYKIIR